MKTEYEYFVSNELVWATGSNPAEALRKAEEEMDVYPKDSPLRDYSIFRYPKEGNERFSIEFFTPQAKDCECLYNKYE